MKKRRVRTGKEGLDTGRDEQEPEKREGGGNGRGVGEG